MCTGLAENGVPVESFVVDPPIAWDDEFFRGIRLRERHVEGEVIFDAMMFVGAQNYAYPPDFVEEVRRLGMSKRVPISSVLQKLQPHKSRIYLIHNRCIFPDGYKLHGVHRSAYPKIERPHIRGEHMHGLFRSEEDEQCTFSLWDISSLYSGKNRSIEPLYDEGNLVGDAVKIKLAGISYGVMKPEEIGGQKVHETGLGPMMVFTPGIFMAIPFTHFEYVNKEEKSIPNKVANKLGANIAFTEVTST
ncbi:MAG: hypothetical protein KKF27_21910 [Gammaproteobacteria bacterium]|nr:hypothetical protein [Gammaproteobacteria bacterium]MBU2685907.1 hypothetical protein [Gammaproteobacteria bacterium]